MAYSTLTELNTYATGNLTYTADQIYQAEEGEKLLIKVPTWDYVRSLGDFSGNNLSINHTLFTTGYQPKDNPSGRSEKIFTSTGTIRPMDEDNKKWVASLLFDGTESISFNDGDFNFGNNEAFALEFWINMPSNSNATHIFDTRLSGYDELSGAWTVSDRPYLVTQNRTLYLRTGTDSAPTNHIDWYGAGDFAYDTWHHIAITGERNLNTLTLKLYVNGTQRGSTTNIGYFTGQTLTFGRSDYGSNSYFIGRLEDIRFSDNIVYSSGFTPPTAQFTANSTDLLLLQASEYNIQKLSGIMTISFDDYLPVIHNTNINNANGNITITGLNDAEDWIGGSLYLDVPRDYAGNVEFTTTITNSSTNAELIYDQTVIWNNLSEFSTVDLSPMVYDYLGNTFVDVPVTTEFSEAQITQITDVENSDPADIYTINLSTGVANLAIFTTDTANLTSITGNNTSNLTMSGSRSNINLTLNELSFSRLGDVSYNLRQGNIVWTLTNPDSGHITTFNQSYYPQYSDPLYETDEFYYENPEFNHDVVPLGLDDENNPMFLYSFSDYGVVKFVTHKIEYETGNLLYGETVEASLIAQNHSLKGPLDGVQVGNASITGGSCQLISAIDVYTPYTRAWTVDIDNLNLGVIDITSEGTLTNWWKGPTDSHYYNISEGLTYHYRYYDAGYTDRFGEAILGRWGASGDYVFKINTPNTNWRTTADPTDWHLNSALQIIGFDYDSGVGGNVLAIGSCLNNPYQGNSPRLLWGNPKTNNWTRYGSGNVTVDGSVANAFNYVYNNSLLSGTSDTYTTHKHRLIHMGSGDWLLAARGHRDSPLQTSKFYNLSLVAGNGKNFGDTTNTLPLTTSNSSGTAVGAFNIVRGKNQYSAYLFYTKQDLNSDGTENTNNTKGLFYKKITISNVDRSITLGVEVEVVSTSTTFGQYMAAGSYTVGANDYINIVVTSAGTPAFNQSASIVAVMIPNT